MKKYGNKGIGSSGLLSLYIVLFTILAMSGSMTKHVMAASQSTGQNSQYRIDSSNPHERAAAQLYEALTVIEEKLKNASVDKDPDQDNDLQWALSKFFISYKQLYDHSSEHQIPPPNLDNIRLYCRNLSDKLLPSKLDKKIKRICSEIIKTKKELEISEAIRNSLTFKIKGNIALNMTTGLIESMKVAVTGVGLIYSGGLTQVVCLVNAVADKVMEEALMPSEVDPKTALTLKTQNERLREYYNDHKKEINHRVARWIRDTYFSPQKQYIPCRTMNEYIELLQNRADKRAALQRRFFEEVRVQLQNEHIPFLKELLEKQKKEVIRIQGSSLYRKGRLIYNKYKKICRKILSLIPWTTPARPTPQAQPDPGYIEFQKIEYAASENAGEVTISVIRKGGTSGSVWVLATPSRGSATEWEDFDPVPQKLVWDDGEGGVKTFKVYLRDDTKVEEREFVSLLLEAPPGGVKLGVHKSAKLWIKDNDSEAAIKKQPPVTADTCRFLEIKPNRIQMKPGQTVKLTDTVRVIAVMNDLSERDVTNDPGTSWSPGRQYTAPPQSNFNKRIQITATYLTCRASIIIDVEYPFWSSPISRAGDTGKKAPKPGLDEYRWWVFCEKRTGTVVYGKYPDRGKHIIMEGPFPGQRTAEKWIMDNCPRARCTVDGKCATTPARGGDHCVICDRETGTITFSSHKPKSLRYAVMAEGLRGEPEARLWLEQNCPTKLCTPDGTCAKSSNLIGTGRGEYYVICYLPAGKIEIGNKPIDIRTEKIIKGPFPGEPHARLWVKQNCPEWACDPSGQCVSWGISKTKRKDHTKTTTVKPDDGSWFDGYKDELTQHRIKKYQRQEQVRQQQYRQRQQYEQDNQEWMDIMRAISKNFKYIAESAAKSGQDSYRQRREDERKRAVLPYMSGGPADPRSKYAKWAEEARMKKEQCDKIKKELQAALRSRNLQTSKKLLARSKGCDFYERARNILHDMERDDKCKQLRSELDKTYRSKNIFKYRVALNQAKECNFYDQACERLKKLEETTRPCNKMTKCQEYVPGRGWASKIGNAVVGTPYGLKEVSCGNSRKGLYRCYDECAKKWRCYEY